jgi:hypothetical protein
MKPLTLQEVYEKIDKSLFDEVKLFNGGAKTQSIDFWIAGEVIELWDTGDISMFRTPSEPQLLEIQKAQRLLLVGEE